MNSNKRFLLVHPEISRTKYNFAGIIDNEPLELEYLSALLKANGYLAEIWDGQVDKEPFSAYLRRFQPDFVYICGRTRQESFMLEYAADAKKSGAVTMIGGLHAQLCCDRFFNSDADYIFTGFDITLVLQIAEGAAPETLHSLCYRGTDGSWQVLPAKPADIRALPRPDRTKFYAHDYRYLELVPCAQVRTAYSCPYRCKFCIRNRMNCSTYSTRDIADVVDEIAGIRCENIYITDDDFLYGEERLRTFIRLIRERGIKKRFVCYGRADFIAKHKTLMRELKEIGFYYILVGLEAVSDRYLTQYNKRSDMWANVRAVRILNELGIHIMGMFIVDLDFEKQDFQNIYRFVRANRIKHAAISIFTPEMNTELFEQYRSRLITDDPACWDYLHVVAKPSRMSVRRYYMHYHILVVRLFLRAWRQGVYDFIDYGYFIRSMLGNLFRFGG